MLPISKRLAASPLANRAIREMASKEISEKWDITKTVSRKKRGRTATRQAGGKPAAVGATGNDIRTTNAAAGT